MLGYENSRVSRKEGMGVKQKGLRKMEKLLLSIAVFAYAGLKFKLWNDGPNLFFFLSENSENTKIRSASSLAKESDEPTDNISII